LAQPSVVHRPAEHGGGLLAFYRDRAHKNVYTATSADGGKTWTKAARSKLPNNNSGLQACTLLSGRVLHSSTLMLDLEVQLRHFCGCFSGASFISCYIYLCVRKLPRILVAGDEPAYLRVIKWTIVSPCCRAPSRWCSTTATGCCAGRCPSRCRWTAGTRGRTCAT
jgi:hypothetical protein